MTATVRDDYDAMTDAEFRTMVRDFIEAECPAEIRHLPRRIRWHEVKPWSQKLGQRGWLAPQWPKTYGGMGMSVGKQIAFLEELDRAGVPRAPDMGIVMLGPLLINYGTEEQRQQYLPRILACEDVWCQGYSEPNAGSDLASLRLEAVLDGDHWVVNGQKTWTTLAQDANWIFLLVRTDKSAKKQEGISFLLVDLATPGVTRRPIMTLGGMKSSAKPSSTMCACPRTISSARSTKAGRWPRRCSASSASFSARPSFRRSRSIVSRCSAARPAPSRTIASATSSRNCGSTSPTSPKPIRGLPTFCGAARPWGRMSRS